MLQLDNHTPLAAQIVPLSDKDGETVLVVVAKGTYDILDGTRLRLAEVQNPIELVDTHTGEPGASSTVYESDVAIHKPGTDLVLVGEAHAPRRRAVTAMDVHFSVGSVGKTTRVLGDRVWRRTPAGDLSPTTPEPFLQMPLVYERAFGGEDRTDRDPSKHGWEPRNPIGTGFRTNRLAVDGHRLPNLEDPRAPIERWTDRPAPQGFGFVGRHWMPRRAFAGTYDESWERDRAPLLPADFDDRYFQAAHPDLVASPCLSGTERVRATGVSADTAFDFRLPDHQVTATAHFRQSPAQTSTLELDTLVLRAASQSLILVWRTCFRPTGSLMKLFAIELRPAGATPEKEAGS